MIMGGVTHEPRGTNPRVDSQPVPLLSRLKQQHERLTTVSTAVAARIEEYDLLRLEEACQYFINYFETLDKRRKNQELMPNSSARTPEKVYLRAGRTPILDEWESARQMAFWAMPIQPDGQGQVNGLPSPTLVPASTVP